MFAFKYKIPSPQHSGSIAILAMLLGVSPPMLTQAMAQMDAFRKTAPLAQTITKATNTNSLRPADTHIRVGDPLSGGTTTVFVSNQDAFSRPLANLPLADLRAFAFGNKIFNTLWIQAPASVSSLDGLGPTFNRSSCSGCHMRDGRGRPPHHDEPQLLSMLLRISSIDPVSKQAMPHPDYGDQLNPMAIASVPEEGRVRISYQDKTGQYGDGSAYTLHAPHYTIETPLFSDVPLDPETDPTLAVSPRVAPAIFGLGLLAAIPEETLQQWADPDDRDGDGISGRINMVTDETGSLQAGRFGWKANIADLEDQNARAALGDIGLTSRRFPNENCPPRQIACQNAISGGEPELSDKQLDKLTFYTRTLAPPARRDVGTSDIVHGGEIFMALGCAACHKPSVRTGDRTLAALTQQMIQPFTDLLLHDMGPDLADHRPDGQATGREWRTAPLWGIGLIPRVNHHERYLHDGRAHSLAEAILWHGGEAEAAAHGFKNLPAADRQRLVAFLKSL